MSDALRTETEVAQIVQHQVAVKACPQVYGVYVRCEGETDLSAVYDCKEAADLHATWYNKRNRNGYLGRAHVSVMFVKTLAIAQGQFRE